jgi:uncharacterized protein YbaP (TraB family)
MLFQIDDTDVRLAGSMHVVPRGKSIPAWVESTYRWSKVLYLEHNEQALTPRLFLPVDETAEQLLPPDVWQRLTAVWPARFPSLARWKLWMIPSLLALSTVPRDPGVEHRLGQLARNDGRVIKYLETEEELVTLAESIPSSIWLAGINRILENPSAEQQTDVMYEAWMRGDVEKATELFASAQLMKFPIVQSTLIDDRNRLWAQRITALLTLTEPTMIVVGAGHLGGENGLLQLLNDAGCSMSQLA